MLCEAVEYRSQKYLQEKKTISQQKEREIKEKKKDNKGE
jgi:hypothetical protein